MSRQSQQPLPNDYKVAFEHYDASNATEVFRAVVIVHGHESKVIRYLDRPGLDSLESAGRVVSYRRLVFQDE